MTKLISRHLHRVQRDERGSALVIALVMVFVIAIIVTGVLSYSGTGLNASATVSADSRTQAAGDGAMQAAVQFLLSNPTNHCGTPGSAAGLLLRLPSQNGQPASYVTCDTVKVDRTPGTGDGTSDAPQYAILTLGQRANTPSNQGNYNATQFLGSGETSEQGVFFQPALTGAFLVGSCPDTQGTGFIFGFCYKQTGNVVIAGKVFSNSSIGVNNPTGTGTQQLTTSDATNYGFTVRQPCTVSARASITPTCSVVAGNYSDTTQGQDPGFTSRGQWAASQGNFPAKVNVPGCPSGTLVRFSPGWYSSASALNNFFKTCVNADGTAKDFWFQPGVYYFDFQDSGAAAWNPASSTQYCGIGIDYPQDSLNSPPSLGSPGNPGSGISAATQQALEHQWCIRGATASDGSSAQTDDFRPHVVGGVLNSTFNPIAALMSATTATSADFVNPNNAKIIDGTTSTFAWVANNSVMVPLTAASSDFTGFNNATQIDGVLASLALQSSNQSISPGTATSADFVNPNNGKAIDNSVSTLGLQSNNQSIAPSAASSADFVNPNNGRTIDNSVSTYSAGGSNTQSPSAATSTDFVNPTNGRVVDGSLSTLNLSGTTTTQTPGTVNAPGFANPNNAKVIDGANATLAAGSVNATQTAGSVATTQTAGVNDFGTTANATGAPNSTLSSATIANTFATSPGTATSSTVSGTSDFTTTANATGTINATLSTATYSNGGSGSATLAPATGFENSPTSGFNDFTGGANAQGITGGTMNASNSASFSSGIFTTDSGEVRMTGYPDIPAVATPTNVVLTVRHEESTTSSTGVSVVVQDASNNTLCTVAVPTQTNTNPATPFVSVNLGPTANGGNNCLTTAAQVNGVKFDYRVTKTNFLTSATFLLDGMSLAATYSGDTANRTLALSSFVPQVPNPASTIIDAATLSIAHKETANANPQLVLSGANISAAAACNTITLTPSIGGSTDAFNLLTQLTTNCGIASANLAATINGLVATYVTHLSGTGTATVNLDGVNLALTATDPTVRTLTLSNISPTVSATATNVIDKATLSFAHQEQSGGVGPSPVAALVVTPGGGGSCAFPLTVRSSLTTETIDVTTCLNTPTKLNGATYAYQVHLVDGGNVSQSLTASVDGSSVAVTATETGNQTVALSSPAPAVPTGVTIDGSTLSFAHQESGSSTSPRLVLSGVNISAGAGCNTIALTPQAVTATETFNLYSQLTTNCGVSAANLAATINGLSATYTANLGATAGDGASQSATVAVDGLNVTTISASNAVHTLTLSAPSPAVPAANQFDTVTLQIAHQETGAATSPTLTITPGGAAACTGIALTPRATLTTDTVTVPAACLNTVAKINGAAYAYTSHLNSANGDGVTPSATTSVDGITVTVVSTDVATHTLTLSTPSPTVPTSATLAIDTVTLQIAHQETGNNANPTLTITPGGAASCTPIALTSRSVLTTDTVVVPASCLTTPARINGATFAYQVHLVDNGTAQAMSVGEDGIALTVVSTDGAIHTLTLSAPAPAVPATNTLDSVGVQISHQETGSSANPTLTITPGGASACAAIALTPRATLTTDTVALPAGCLNTAAKINGATFAYQVHLVANGTVQSTSVSADGIALAVVSTDTSTHSLTLSAPTPAVPAANTLDTVTLQISHQESGSTANPTLTITPGGASACAAIALTPRATLTTDTVTVPSGCLTTAARINGASYAYQVHLIDTGTAQTSTIGEDGIRVTVVSTDPSTHTITLSNLSNPASATAGSTVTSATLSFAHQELGSNMSPSLVITPGGAAACTAVPLTSQPTLTTSVIDVTSCLNTPTKLNGATIAYQVHLTDTGSALGATANVDGAEIAATTIASGTRTITLGSFGPTLPVTSGWDGLTVNVAHAESAGTNPTLVVTPAGGTPCTIPLTVHTTLATDAIPLGSSCPVKNTTAANGITVQYQATGTTNATAALDGVSLNASYYTRPSAISPTGACDNTQPGVQWIFGGDSHVYIPDATTQLCAGPAPGHPGQVNYSAQQIAVYGVPPTPPMTPSSNTTTGTWTAATNAYKIGDYNSVGASPLTADIAPGTTSKTITLSGFNATTIPAGMVVTNVTARIAHLEDSNVSAPKVAFTNAAGVNCGTTTLPKFTGSVQYSPVDVTSCFNTQAELTGATPISALYTTGTSSSGSSNKEHLDGVALDVTLGRADPNAQVFLPESGCITAYPNFDDGYNNPDCAVMKWDSVESRVNLLFFFDVPFFDMCDGSANQSKDCLPNGQVSLEGTLYSPGAAVAVDDQGHRDQNLAGCGDGNGTSCYTGVDYSIFDRGVIARTVRFNSFKSKSGFTGAIIACAGSNGDPSDNACRGGQITTGYEETLTSKVCPTASDCSTADSGETRITAKVLIPADQSKPAITSWNANQEH